MFHVKHWKEIIMKARKACAAALILMALIMTAITGRGMMEYFGTKEQVDTQVAYYEQYDAAGVLDEYAPALEFGFDEWKNDLRKQVIVTAALYLAGLLIGTDWGVGRKSELRKLKREWEYEDFGRYMNKHIGDSVSVSEYIKEKRHGSNK